MKSAFALEQEVEQLKAQVAGYRSTITAQEEEIRKLKFGASPRAAEPEVALPEEKARKKTR